MIIIEDQINLAPAVTLNVIKVGDGFAYNGELYVLLDSRTATNSALVLRYLKTINKLESASLGLGVLVNPVRAELHIRFSNH